VSADGAACVQPTVEDVAYLTLMFPDGILTHVRVSWLDPSKTRRITVVGSEKMVTYDDVEPNEKIKVYDKGVEALKPPDSFGEFQFNYRYGDIIAPFIEFQEPLRVEAEHFIECVREGTRPMTDGQAGLTVVSVIEALQESLRGRGKPVAISGTAPGSNNDHELERSLLS
jgi:predicted dehydrogenase